MFQVVHCAFGLVRSNIVLTTFLLCFRLFSEAEKVALQKIDARSGDVYRLAKQMRRDNQDVMGEKPVKNDAGQLSLDEESKE